MNHSMTSSTPRMSTADQNKNRTGPAPPTSIFETLSSSPVTSIATVRPTSFHILWRPKERIKKPQRTNQVQLQISAIGRVRLQVRLCHSKERTTWHLSQNLTIFSHHSSISFSHYSRLSPSFLTIIIIIVSCHSVQVSTRASHFASSLHFASRLP